MVFFGCALRIKESLNDIMRRFLSIFLPQSFSFRKPFDEQALADKRRYEQEMGVFKPARDPNKPKRPSTAYFHFLADFRQKMKGTDIGHKDVIR